MYVSVDRSRVVKLVYVSNKYIIYLRLLFFIIIIIRYDTKLLQLAAIHIIF